MVLRGVQQRPSVPRVEHAQKAAQSVRGALLRVHVTVQHWPLRQPGDAARGGPAAPASTAHLLPLHACEALFEWKSVPRKRRGGLCYFGTNIPASQKYGITFCCFLCPFALTVQKVE